MTGAAHAAATVTVDRPVKESILSAEHVRVEPGGLPRRAVILTSIGATMGLLVGLGFLLGGDTGFGLFMLIAVPLSAALNLVTVKRAIRHQKTGTPRHRGRATGHTITPVTARRITDSASWIGGGNVATDIGRMNASWPLAVLDVTDRELTIRFRPKLVTGILGATEARWPVDRVLVVYPVRGRWFRFNKGIAIETASAPLTYFWTRQAPTILTALAEHGLSVDWTERSIKFMP